MLTEGMVPRVGVEPTRLASVDFESTASANSATRATARARKVGRGAAVSNAILSPEPLNASARVSSIPELVTRSFWEVHSLQFKSARAPGLVPGALSVLSYHLHFAFGPLLVGAQTFDHGFHG